MKPGRVLTRSRNVLTLYRESPEGPEDPEESVGIFWDFEMHQPLVAGRDLTPQDAARRDAVIVNQALANKHFGSAAGALGRQLRTRGEA